MILVGVHYPDAELERLLSKVADDPSVLVLTETTSNLSGSRFITSIDNLIFNQSHQEFLALQPNILLTFGGLIISKKIKKFLRDYQPKEHWHIHELRAFDTYFALTKHIKVDSRTFFKNFSSLVHYNKKSDYKHTWITHRDRTYAKHHYFLHTAPFSDLKVFEQVLHAIPSHSQIHFSNSAIIRYSQLFRISKQFIVFCNRGTSGIDGSTSTAIGAALAFKGQTTLVTGDLSFFYDSNALWNSHIPNTFRIILINNAGGSIFKIIPGPSSTSSLDFFETPHKLTAKHLCNMYGFTYLSANNLEGTVRHLSSLYTESNQPKLLEIFTPSGVNDIILKHYIEYLR